MVCHRNISLATALNLQSWRGIKKTGILSGPLFLAVLAMAAFFLSPWWRQGQFGKSIYIDTRYRSVAKANALKADRAWPAAQAISTACEIMQIVAEPNDSLPSMRCRGPRCSGRLRSRFGSGSGCCSSSRCGGTCCGGTCCGGTCRGGTCCGGIDAGGRDSRTGSARLRRPRPTRPQAAASSCCSSRCKACRRSRC